MVTRLIMMVGLMLILIHGYLAEDSYTYYFYTPQSGWLLAIATSQTTLKLYRMTDVVSARYAEISEASLAKMETIRFNLTKGFYMIKASSRIIALLYIGPEDTVRAAVTTQIPSTSGGYVGQEFLFIQLTAPLYIHAFEDAEVRAYNAEGKELGRITLGQNDTKEFKIAGVKPGDVIRISSTGRIAAAQVADQGMMFAVDATGRFKGNNLFGGHYETRGHIILLAYQPCKAVVYLGREKAKIGEHVFTNEEVFKNKYWTMTRPRTSLSVSYTHLTLPTN